MAVYRAQRTTQTHQGYGGFGLRLGAFLIDAVAIGALLVIATLGRPLPVGTQGGADAINWHNLLETTVGFAYFTVLWSWIGGGQTVGMRILGLRVVGTDGEPIGYLAAVARWIGFVISAGLLLVGLVWVAFDPRHQGWHDKLAGTFVVHGDAAIEPVQTAALPAMGTDRPHPIARGFAMVTAALGALLGLLGFGLGLAGDAAIPVGVELWAAGVLAAVAVFAAAIAWSRPGLAALAMVVVVIGYAVALRAFVGPWWDGYNAAVVNPVTEQQYWADAPAIASFIVSAIFVGLAALLSLFGIDWTRPASLSEPGRSPAR